MDVRAVAKNVRISPRKVRLVLDEVRGKPAQEALAQLQFMPQKAAGPVRKALQSAVVNAENNFELDADKLVVSAIQADDARTLRRYRPKARGRVGYILKRSSHITVTVSEREA